MTGQVVDAVARDSVEIELLQVQDDAGRVWEFVTEGPIGIDAARLLVHRELGQGVEVVYTERNDRLIALEVNDLASGSPKPTSVATAGPAEVKVADPIIGDPRYLIGDGKVSASPQSGSVYVCSRDFRGGGA